MNGAELIAAERRRQVEQEGWSPEHDDEHDRFEMGRAARAYCAAAQAVADKPDYFDDGGIQPDVFAAGHSWPWGYEWFKPSDDPVRNLVKAGALIAAEIDRLQRRQATPMPQEHRPGPRPNPRPRPDNPMA